MNMKQLAFYLTLTTRFHDNGSLRVHDLPYYKGSGVVMYRFNPDHHLVDFAVYPEGGRSTLRLFAHGQVVAKGRMVDGYLGPLRYTRKATYNVQEIEMSVEWEITTG